MIATPASLVGETRTALVPALYAYWERFFRLVFAEYLRCISLGGFPLSKLSVPLAVHRVRRDVLQLETSHRDGVLRKLDKEGAQAARQYLVSVVGNLQRIEQIYNSPVDFPQPDEWIRTDSNVRYEVVERNCRNIGVDPEALKKILLDSNIHLHPKLKTLVDTRNNIAHGNVIGPTSSSDWDEMQGFVVTLMNAVQLFLYDALASDAHLCP